MCVPEISPWNGWVVDEFRANRGKVGGEYNGFLMILVHHVGAKSGIARINPMVYQAVGDNFAVFASKRGAPRHPDWYHNLMATPRTKVEIGTAAGTEIIEVKARDTEGEEREKIWEAQKAAMPVFREYEAVAGRVIPVVLLERG
jgi:deazaflavin-dependent oxidoreductase (nitroreductase family)